MYIKIDNKNPKENFNDAKIISINARILDPAWLPRADTECRIEFALITGFRQLNPRNEVLITSPWQYERLPYNKPIRKPRLRGTFLYDIYSGRKSVTGWILLE